MATERSPRFSASPITTGGAADGRKAGGCANRGRDLPDSRGGEDEHSVYREGLCCAPQRGDEAGMMQWIWIVAFTWAALLYFAPELFQLYRRWSLARKRARTLKKWHTSARQVDQEAT